MSHPCHTVGLKLLPLVHCLKHLRVSATGLPPVHWPLVHCFKHLRVLRAYPLCSRTQPSCTCLASSMHTNFKRRDRNCAASTSSLNKHGYSSELQTAKQAAHPPASPWHRSKESPRPSIDQAPPKKAPEPVRKPAPAEPEEEVPRRRYSFVCMLCLLGTRCWALRPLPGCLQEGSFCAYKCIMLMRVCVQ